MATMMQMQMLIHVVSFSALFCISISTDTLSPSQPLLDGQTLVSAVGTFTLGFFSPGGSKNRYVGIWYNKLRGQTVVWVANRSSPIADTNGTMELNSNGTLTINSMIFLPMPSVILTNPVAQLLDDGNLVIREANSNEFAWQSFDYPTDTLLPGMKLGWDLRTDLNRNLTAWRSNDDPSPGRYACSVDINGSPQLTLLFDSAKIWRSGPWDGAEFSNTPKASGLGFFFFSFVNTDDEVFYIYETIGTDIMARLTVDHTGILELFMRIKKASEWNLTWLAPQTQCDSVLPCGPNALCDPNSSPVCGCLPGFTPKSPINWALRDGASGCVRRTEMDCKNKTDRFLAITQVVLPDTATAIVDTTVSTNECRDKCLENCSCTGYASADIRGTGCIIWMKELVGLGTASHEGQDFYVRLAATELDNPTAAKGRAKVVVITILSGVALVIALIGFYAWRKKRMKQRASVAHDQHAMGIREDDELELPQFQWSTLIEATGNFIETNILGKGGFGPVYKGKLAEGREIAVKRLSKTSAQGIDEFKNEVILIAKLQHRNLVRLLGYCIQGDERILVYEYMPNGSLDAFLFDIVPDGVHLDWQTRFHIIVGIARGLLYLHQDSRLRIIHRDLKASNILLDSGMNPKISDFGLARIFGENETITKTRKVVGTYGYMAPEYALDGIFSVKSDVFSFGVLILEIISGQRNRVFISTPHLYLLGHAWSIWNEENALGLLDPSIGNSFSMTQVMRCVNIGLLCVQGKPEDRPIMSSVVFMLSNDDAPLAKPKAPGFNAILSAESESTLNQVDLHSFNNVTLTEQTGR